MTDIKNVIKELEAIGIHDVKEVVYNPSYEQLFEEETKPGLEGFEKGTLTTTGAVVKVHLPQLERWLLIQGSLPVVRRKINTSF